MPLIGTRGAASAQGFGEFAQQTAANYIEDVFSTYLYTGNGTTQTITNGIDLSTYGGLVWCKNRASNLSGSESHEWYDTVRGAGYGIFSNATSAQQNYGSSRGVTAFSTTGFTVTNSSSLIGPNANGITEVGWTFRKQAKFFDVVTYTGNGTTQTVSHNLGALPGCIIAKRTDSSADWVVWHRGNSSNLTSTITGLSINRANGAYYTSWDASAYMTSTSFNPAYMFDYSATYDANINGATYVAYIFAHNAGGFGATASDNVISCGSYTGTGTTPQSITLGYEPQWLLIKRVTSGTNDWILFDNMRGMPVGSADSFLRPNTSAAEDSLTDYISPTATGFDTVAGSSNTNGSGQTYIYIAIRRGPMKTPTSGTSVFAPVLQTPPAGPQTITTNFPVDLSIFRPKAFVDGGLPIFIDRLRGTTQIESRWLTSSSNAAESYYGAGGFGFDNNTGYVDNLSYNIGYNGKPEIFWNFRRAPSFMDEVCYTGNGTSQNINHNLGVVPELIIAKQRSTLNNWSVYSAAIGSANELIFNNTGSSGGSSAWNSTTPTSSVFSVGANGRTNGSGGTYVAYLFASCPGVSKVGSFTGTGATLTISCGFAARFVMIKRTDDVGSWFVWDTARGMVAGSDPRLAFNSTAAEVNENWVYTDASGFQIVTTDATVNASGGSYIYLAIA